MDESLRARLLAYPTDDRESRLFITGICWDDRKEPVAHFTAFPDRSDDLVTGTVPLTEDEYFRFVQLTWDIQARVTETTRRVLPV